MLEKQQNWVVLLSYIKGYCIWGRGDAWTNKTYFSGNSTSFPQFGVLFLPLGLGFFLQKRKKAFGDSGLSFSFKKNAFWQALRLFRQNQHKTLTSLHTHTHTCTTTTYLTNELTRTLSTQQKTAAD